MINELFPDQVEAYQDIRASIGTGVKRLMVQAPTGYGKTKLAAKIMTGVISKGNQAAFVVPSIDLIDQTVASFWEEGVRDVGVIQSDHGLQDWSRPVQVCSIQTIERRDIYPRAAVVLIDEAHRMYEAHKKWMQHPDWQAIPFIGLSATPWAKKLGNYFQSLLVAGTTRKMIDLGRLSKFTVFAAGKPDLTGVKTVTNRDGEKDYQEQQLSQVMRKDSLVADIVKTYKERWGKGKTLVYGVDRAHAKTIQERFNHAGIRCGYQDAETPMDERRWLKAAFHRGDLDVVSNVATLCLDEKTEILTAEGWVGIDGMTYGHHIAAWADEGRIEFTPPKFIVRRDREPHERMVSIEGRMQNIRVTSNHRMQWSKTGVGFSIKAAADIVGQSGFIPVSGVAPARAVIFDGLATDVRRKRTNTLAYKYRQEGINASDARDLAVMHQDRMVALCSPRQPSALSLDECAFIGFWLGDGTGYAGRFSLSQSKRYPKIIAWVDDLIERVGLHCTRCIYPPASKSRYESVRWNLVSGRGGRDQWRAGGLAPLMPYLVKNGSPHLWGLDAGQLRALLHGYWLADGNHGDGVSPSISSRGRRIHGRRKELFDLLQAIGACRGFRMSISESRAAHRKSAFYSMTYVERRAMQLVRERFKFEDNYSPERVWCVTSTTGNIITRRGGKVAVVGNTTGVDWDVRCISLARPTQSEMLYTQIFGRGLRVAEGKDELIFLDHTETTAKLGFVTDIHHEELHTGKPSRSRPRIPKQPKECPKCTALKDRGSLVCSNCGYTWDVRSAIVEADGELERIESLADLKRRKRKPENWTMGERETFLAEMKAIAGERGYKPGWASNQYRTKFGSWPPREIEHVAPREPSPSTRSWVKSRQIAWFKSRRREEAHA